MVRERRIRSPRLRRRSRREEVVEDLYEREKAEGIRNEENDYDKVLQELYSICTALPREAAQEKETPDINFTLKLEDLVVTPIKNSSEKILTGIESTDATVKFYRSKETNHEYRRNKIEKDEKKLYLDSSKGPELDDEETWKTEKDEKSGIKRKDRIIVSASKPGKSCSERREGRVEDDESDNEIVAKMKEMNSTSYSGDGIEKTDEFKTYHSSSQGTTGRDNDGAVEDDDYADNDKMMVEEDAEIAIDEKGLAIIKLDRACELWLKKVKKFRKMVNKPKVYQKNGVKPERSLCENVDGKVLVVKRGLLDDDSNIKKETGKNKIEGNAKGNLDAQVGLGSCYQKGGKAKREIESNGTTRIERNVKEELAVKKNKEEADKSNRGEHTGRIFNVDNTNRIYETGYKVKNEDKSIEMGFLLTYPKLAKMDRTNKMEDPEGCRVGIEVRVDDRKNENEAVNKDTEDKPDDDSGETIADDEEKSGIINMLDRRKSDQTKDKNSGIIPAKTCDKRDGSDDIKTVGINDESNGCNTFVYCRTVAGTNDVNMTECCYQEEIGFKENKTFTWNLQSAGDGNIIVRTNPGGRYDDINCSRNSISPFENQKAKLEWNLEPTEGGCPGTKGLEGLENSRPDRMDVCSIDLKLAVDKFESKNIWSEDQFQGSNVRGIGNDSSEGIILVSQIKGEEDQRRRIVSNDGRYQTNNKKIEDLPISDQEVIQNIEYAKKGVMVASEVGDINNVIIENEMNNLLFDPGGNILPKTKENEVEVWNKLMFKSNFLPLATLSIFMRGRIKLIDSFL
ncbi:hypothetical protein F8M41_000507 [Gigaspora margarita]|uniref:Uncharacterized protein n=1 Tax=Gigaspora margarita TaxID=4874 RepID=A0A8H4AAV4_GIGMA|nr:hypothetical protein F8M41_000507 [Gigaspora margarita]